MLKQSPFFEFLNRRSNPGFEEFVTSHNEKEHYINWNGFLLANDYGDAAYEYHAIRNSCAICDVTPLRKIRVHGQDAGAFLDCLVTRPISTLPIMRAAYVVFCEESGAFKDDAIVYKYADDDYLMMPSDIDHRPYFESVSSRFGIDAVTFDECTDKWAGVAMQGPASATALQRMGFDAVDQLQPFEVREFFLGGGAICIARIGFTADLGYECWMSPSLVNAFAENIVDVRTTMNIDLPGYGLDALQVCRLEGGFIVAGWDCSTEIDPQPGFERTPLELGLSWLVDLDSDFIGRDALLKQKQSGLTHSLRYFSTDLNVQLEDGAEILANDNDEVIGRVNNSMWSWGLEKTIGNASLHGASSEKGDGRVLVKGESIGIRFHYKPLIDLERRNQVPAPIV
ncbi:MAG: aminomethyltransferase family protein [Woeseiaceae bacterium]